MDLKWVPEVDECFRNSPPVQWDDDGLAEHLLDEKMKVSNLGYDISYYADTFTDRICHILMTKNILKT